MDMRDGTLGVVIVAIAMVLSFAGAYIAGVDSEVQEVTRYNYLTVVDGLFETEQSPQYIEFDPSSNYTGYYSEPSVNPFLDGKYFFAEDKVGFTPYVDRDGNPRINNYKVDLEPKVYTKFTINLTDGIPSNFHPTDAKGIQYYAYDPQVGQRLDDYVSGSYSVVGDIAPSEGGTPIAIYLNNIYVVNLSDILSYFNITDPGQYLLTSPSNDSEINNLYPYNDFNSNWVLFSYKDSWVFKEYPLTDDWWTLTYASTDFNKMNGTNFPNLPAIACKIDLKGIETTDNTTKYLGTAYIYAENGMYTLIDSMTIEDCVVTYAKEISEGDTYAAWNLALDSACTYQILSVAYLDPNDGVWMKETE